MVISEGHGDLRRALLALHLSPHLTARKVLVGFQILALIIYHIYRPLESILLTLLENQF